MMDRLILSILFIVFSTRVTYIIYEMRINNARRCTIDNRYRSSNLYMAILV